jgi:hypothetical protein
MMLKADLDNARDRLDNMREEVQAAEIRQAHGTATGPCDLAVAQALHSMAEQKHTQALASYNALGT